MLALLHNQTDFYNRTTLHPVGFTVVLLLGMLVLGAPRKFAALPMLIMACSVAPAQRIVIGTLDFNMMRIMVLFGWLRLVSRGEYRGLRWCSADTALVAWSVIAMLAFTFLNGTVGALVNRLGRTYDFVGMYLSLRCVIRDWKDFQVLITGALILSIPSFVAFLVEKQTGRNVFAFLGGVPETTKVREGSFRCQGPFPHPILAGSFWASLVPLAIAYWWKRGGRGLAVVGVPLMIGIVIMSASSTPVGGVAAGFFATWMFRFRRQMPVIRWSVVGVLTVLHFAMQAPVWHLISRIDLVGGSTGYHRYNLVNQTILRFDQWWLFGVKSTRSWGYNLNDTANQYVQEAVNGGLGGLVAFVVVLGLAFRNIGRLWRRVRFDRAKLRMAWGLAAALFAQAVMFIAISISYSQQNLLALNIVLAGITSLSMARVRRPARMMPRPARAAA